jgi:hypothetical protein
MLNKQLKYQREGELKEIDANGEKQTQSTKQKQIEYLR